MCRAPPSVAALWRGLGVNDDEDDAMTMVMHTVHATHFKPDVQVT